MKTKYYLFLTILFMVMIFVIGCAAQQQKLETPSIEKTPAPEIKQNREDFSCFYSCDFFPAGSKQMCEDWNAGKGVQWPPDCKMMQYGPCIKLCEFEKKNNPQASQNFPENNSQQQDSNQSQQQPVVPLGVPASDPEAGSVYIYIADHASCEQQCEKYSHIDSRIIRIDDLTGKNWVSFGTFGNGTNQLQNPFHLTLGPDGKLYIPDSGNDRIVRIDDMTGKGWITYGVHGRTGKLNTPSQVNLPPGEGRLIFPSKISFDSKGRIYIIHSSELVRIDDMTGKGWTTFGSPGSDVNQFFKGKGLDIDSKDRIYIIDAGNHRIIRIDDMTGKGWVTFGSKGSGVGQFEDEVNGGVLDSQERIYMVDEHNNRIVRIDDMTGKGWVEFKGLPNDPLKEPHDITIMKNGHIYILDTYNHRVVRIDDMTGKGWIAFAPDAKTEDPRNYHKWRMEQPHGMVVVER